MQSLKNQFETVKMEKEEKDGFKKLRKRYPKKSGPVYVVSSIKSIIRRSASHYLCGRIDFGICQTNDWQANSKLVMSSCSWKLGRGQKEDEETSRITWTHRETLFELNTRYNPWIPKEKGSSSACLLLVMYIRLRKLWIMVVLGSFLQGSCFHRFAVENRIGESISFLEKTLYLEKLLCRCATMRRDSAYILNLVKDRPYMKRVCVYIIYIYICVFMYVQTRPPVCEIWSRASCTRRKNKSVSRLLHLLLDVDGCWRMST